MGRTIRQKIFLRGILRSHILVGSISIILILLLLLAVKAGWHQKIPPIIFQHQIDVPLPENEIFQTVEHQARYVPFADNFSIARPQFPEAICPITDFGAESGGKTSNTQAFARAIAECSRLGGGTVLVPAGIWLTGPIKLHSHIDLHLEKGARIVFSTDFNEYLPVVFSRFEGIEYYNFSPLISATESVNVAVTGEGTIDGQGHTWWKLPILSSINQLYAQGEDAVPVRDRVYGTPDAGLRPAFLEFIHCRNVLIDGVTIIDSPMWTIHPLYSDQVSIQNVQVRTSPGPSTDGVVIDSSSNVLVEWSTFDTGDDAIVMKSGRDKDGIQVGVPTKNVVVRQNQIIEAHSALAIGSEMSGDVNNIFFENNHITRAQFGLRIKSSPGRGGVVENVWADTLTIDRLLLDMIQITTTYGSPFRPDSSAQPTLRNIHIENITCSHSDRWAIAIYGIVDHRIRDVFFKNIFAKSRMGITLKATENVLLDTINIHSKHQPFITVSDSQAVRFVHTDCPAGTPLCASTDERKKE